MYSICIVERVLYVLYSYREVPLQATSNNKPNQLSFITTFPLEGKVYKESIFTVSVREGLTLDSPHRPHISVKKIPTRTHRHQHCCRKMTTDAADEAGGEIVYSSETAAISIRPPPIFQKEDNKDQQELVSEASVPVEQAFEIFAGKLYPVPGYSTSLTQGTDTTETPLQRLGRLQHEILEVESDLSPSQDPEILVLISKLKGKLEKQQQAASYSHQKDIFSQQISTSSTDNDSGSGGDSLTKEDSYVLLQRIERMEKLVGSSLLSSSTSNSLMDRLIELESQATKLSDTQMEILSKKAKVIRQDLEAASKARNKLTSLSRAEDTKSITEIYDEMSQLQGMTAHLPALVERLRILSQLHQDSTSWSQRLVVTEEAAGQLQNQMASIESSLTTLETTLRENAEQLTENIKILEEKHGK